MRWPLLRRRTPVWDFPDDLLEAAWGIIANASDWLREDRSEWQQAAKRWRDAYHKTLDSADEEPGG